ncbi:CLUMA_CG014539, isoform A [Clunio marinus]|uniref:CLUMA_CG014539, isoform A n=1 Tax=Clunio marinus TaxID=568069 RepID=A0A1J1IL25_9DIPT|nr:CLUMA_CG014539, isoform A [Clunio marinus]
MEFQLLTVFVVLSTLQFDLTLSQNCNEVPTFNISDCCKFPDIASEKMVHKIKQELAKTPNQSKYLKACRFYEKLFKRCDIVNSDNQIDKAAARKYFDAQIADDDWKQIFADAVDECIDDINDEDFPTNSRCDVRFIAAYECISLYAFRNCKDSDFTDCNQCNTAKDFAENCDGTRSMSRYLNNQICDCL